MGAKDDKRKEILKPSVIHDELPEIESPPASETISVDDIEAPETPERHYHHDRIIFEHKDPKAINGADDDEWNGEDA